MNDVRVWCSIRVFNQDGSEDKSAHGSMITWGKSHDEMLVAMLSSDSLALERSHAYCKSQGAVPGFDLYF
jgi:hypothetical protein